MLDTQITSVESNLIGALATTIEDTVSPLVSRGARVALVDFPNHANVGDSAIWLGQKALIRKLNLKDIYNCDWRTYSRSHMADRITDDTTILLSGGGNIGDIWPEGQQFREAIITDFPKNRIIQLPQSISFSDTSNLKTAKQCFEKHKDFTLLVRDKPSLNFARDNFNCPISLCPDMAFQLGELRRPSSPSKKVVCLLRSDKESKGFAEQAISLNLEPCDWLSETEQFEQVNRVVTGLWKPGQNIWRQLDFCIGPVYDMTAGARLNRGLKILGDGQVVLTDRLHAHILCVLLRIPHVLLDNSYGKVKHFVDAWTIDSPFVHFAESLPEARELLNSGSI
jgi:exopolysaccharide biosynthesis predicted pyruvyltransferase EpsI